MGSIYGKRGAGTEFHSSKCGWNRVKKDEKKQCLGLVDVDNNLMTSVDLTQEALFKVETMALLWG